MQTIENEIRQLAPLIWDSMLQLPLEPEESVVSHGTRAMAACVHITGAWNGAVALNCSADFAVQVAAIMFDLAEAAPSTAELQDALGELANMVAGNIKALLPEPSHLSLPAVVEGAEYSLRIPGSKVVTRVPFRCGSHALSISPLQQQLKAA